MIFPYVATALAAFLIILQQVLMMSVGFHRAKTKVGVGVADDRNLERKVRRHGNLSENAAILVVVLALAETMGASQTVVITFAALFAVARLSHAVGFMHLDGSHNPAGNKFFIGMRAAGATTTGFGGIALGGYVLYLLFFANA
ncbi:MAG: MAPEG family protein [Pseudomonadota bacterium]